MNRIQLSRALIVCIALGLAANSSHAQPLQNQTPFDDVAAIDRAALAPVETAPEGTERVKILEYGPDGQTARIRVKVEVTAEMLAYWLDSTHHPMPLQIRMSQAAAGAWATGRGEMPRQPGNANGPLDFKLPAGIEIVSTVSWTETEFRNYLIVKGTAAGIEALAKLVEQIEVPLNSVKVESKLIEVAPATLASWPLVFRDAAEGDEKSSTPYGLGDFFASTAFAAPISDVGPLTQKLNEAIADGSARIINQPRLFILDGLAKSVNSTESRVVNFTATADATQNDEKDAAPTRPYEKFDEWKQGATRVKVQTGFAAAPVLHGDVMNLGFQITLNNIATVGSAVMRDGQTIAVRLPNVNSATGDSYVALIQARVFRLAED